MTEKYFEYKDIEAVVRSRREVIREPEGMSDVLYLLQRMVKPADVSPVVHGEWVENGGIYSCSVCGYAFEHEGYNAFFRYCPNCGAKMDGAAKQENNSAAERAGNVPPKEHLNYWNGL